MSPEGFHRPAMLLELLELLQPGGSGTWLDGTVGGAGHARAIAERLAPEALLIGIDRDPRAIEAARAALEGVGCRVELVRSELSDLGEVVDERGGMIRGALLDVGLSSDQIDRGSGFSFRDTEAPLDMRQSPDAPVDAAAIVNHTDQKALADLIYCGSQERFSRRIAGSIVRSRPLETVGELVGAVHRALPRGYRQHDDVLRRVFQSLRYAVGHDLEQLEEALAAIIERLEPGGVVAVLAYNSSEDAIAKTTFRAGKAEGSLEILTPKPLRPGPDEVRANSRSKAARLRAARKL